MNGKKYINEIQRVMPHNDELELEAISVIIASPSSIFEENMHRLVDDDFYNYHHVWKFVSATARRREALSMSSIVNHLVDIEKEQLEEDEKEKMLAEYDINTEQLVNTLQKLRQSRVIAETASESLRLAYSNKPNKAINLLSDLRRKMKEIDQGKSREKTAAEIASEVDTFLFSNGQDGNISNVPMFDRTLDTFTGGFPVGVMSVLLARPSMGKALVDSSRVLTTNGWKKMTELSVGNRIKGSDGRDHRLIGIYPQGKKEIAIVEFDDGTQIECSYDHLWTVHPGDDINKTVDTKELQRLTTLRGKQFYLPPAPIVHGPRCNLRYSTLYLLGAFIARGTFDYENGEIRYSTQKKEVAQEIARLIRAEYSGGEIGIREKVSKHGHLWYNLYIGGENELIRFVTHFREKNKRLPSWKKHAEETEMKNEKLKKLISDFASRISIDQKLEMVRGIVDISGVWQDNGVYLSLYHPKEASKSAVSKHQMAIRMLVRSLGFKVTRMLSADKFGMVKIHHAWSMDDLTNIEKGLSLHDSTQYKIAPSLIKHDSELKEKSREYGAKVIQSAYRNPFKSYPYRKRLVNVTSKGTEEECTCISVDSPDQLFITNNFTLTHNTRFLLSSALYAAIWAESMYPGKYMVKYFSQDGAPRHILGGAIVARYGYSIDQWRSQYERIPKSIKDAVREDNEYISKRLPLFWNDDSGVTPNAMSDSLLQDQEITGRQPILVIADYMQNYVPNEGTRYSGNPEKVGKTAEQFFNNTREADSYALVVASQLPKEVDNRADRKPKMGDGKYASEIEEKSELILGLYREDYYEKTMTEQGDILVLKKKTGGKDEVVSSNFKNGLWIPKGGGWGMHKDALDRDILGLRENQFVEVMEI